MGFNCGIIGLPNVGKSTIFNAIASAQAQMENYPFCTIEPNRGVVAVPDRRLHTIARVLGKEDPIPTTIELVDVAGLVQGASKGEGLGNKFLGHVRSVDAIIHVVRCFRDADVAHSSGDVNPLQDVEIVNTELMLADMALLEHASERLAKQAKAGEKDATHRLQYMADMIEELNKGVMLNALRWPDPVTQIAQEYGLITFKPILYLANSDESGQSAAWRETIEDFAATQAAACVFLLGKLEQEISELEDDEKQDFLEAMGLQQSALNRLVEKAYGLLDIITFYTATTAVQAWTVGVGTSVYAAAGRIHTDFQKGFVRAEVCHSDNLVESGSEHHAREKGLLRTEGKDYTVQDGDVIHFLFNP